MFLLDKIENICIINKIIILHIYDIIDEKLYQQIITIIKIRNKVIVHKVDLIGILGGLIGLVRGSIRLHTIIKIFKIEPRIAVGTNMLIS